MTHQKNNTKGAFSSENEEYKSLIPSHPDNSFSLVIPLEIQNTSLLLTTYSKQLEKAGEKLIAAADPTSQTSPLSKLKVQVNNLKDAIALLGADPQSASMSQVESLKEKISQLEPGTTKNNINLALGHYERSMKLTTKEKSIIETYRSITTTHTHTLTENLKKIKSLASDTLEGLQIKQKTIGEVIRSLNDNLQILKALETAGKKLDAAAGANILALIPRQHKTLEKIGVELEQLSLEELVEKLTPDQLAIKANLESLVPHIETSKKVLEQLAVAHTKTTKGDIGQMRELLQVQLQILSAREGELSGAKLISRPQWHEITKLYDKIMSQLDRDSALYSTLLIDKSYIQQEYGDTGLSKAHEEKVSALTAELNAKDATIQELLNKISMLESTQVSTHPHPHGEIALPDSALSLEGSTKNPFEDADSSL